VKGGLVVLLIHGTESLGFQYFFTFLQFLLISSLAAKEQTNFRDLS
jgi:hypothetical protein